MKITFGVAVAAFVLAGQAYAQQYVDQYGNPVQVAPQQKVVQYDETTNTVVEVAPQQSVQLAPAQPIIVQQAAPQPIMIKRVQEQPVTVVEGSLLKDSKADQLRKARTDMETDTEQKIVEKLEEARMRDEQARAEKLFGGVSLVPAPAATPAPAPIMAQPVAPPTVEVVSGSTAAAEAKLEIKKEEAPAPNIKEEVKMALQEQEASKKKESRQQVYVSAIAGMGEYPDVINMQGTGAAGFSVGVVNKNRVVVEGSFVYSSYDIEDITQSSGGFPVFKELTQYNTSAAVKFQILPGSFRPFLGALASYTHRTYSDRQGWATHAGPDASTASVDLGVTAGLDIMINENFAVGGDFKYMTNLTSRQDSKYKQSIVNQSYNYGTPVEELDYYAIGIVGKFLF